MKTKCNECNKIFYCRRSSKYCCNLCRRKADFKKAKLKLKEKEKKSNG